MALEWEPAASHDPMISAHLDALRVFAYLAKAIVDHPAHGDGVPADFGARLGFELLLFAAQLGFAIFNEPWGRTTAPALRREAADVVTFAILQATALLSPFITRFRRQPL